MFNSSSRHLDVVTKVVSFPSWRSNFFKMSWQNPADTKTSQRRRKNVLIWRQKSLRLVWDGIRGVLLLRLRQDVSRTTPQYLLKTSQDISKTFSSKSKRPSGNHTWTFYLSTFKTAYILLFHNWQTNYISMNKLRTLKHGNNTWILKIWF